MAYRSAASSIISTKARSRRRSGSGRRSSACPGKGEAGFPNGTCATLIVGGDDARRLDEAGKMSALLQPEENDKARQRGERADHKEGLPADPLDHVPGN